jgi:RimJ/RimL family protein N-acetyltransferase
MLARSYDAEFLNRIVNDPAMEWARLGVKSIDLTEAVSNPENVFLANEFGGFLFVRDGDVYEVHSNLTPEGRGRAAFEAARAAAFFMFTETPCLAIRTLVPKGNFAAAALTRKMGFTHWGDTEINGRECRMFMLTIKEWARRLKCRQ